MARRGTRWTDRALRPLKPSIQRTDAWHSYVQTIVGTYRGTMGTWPVISEYSLDLRKIKSMFGHSISEGSQ